MKPYQELIDFIAETTDRERLAKFRPSKAAQARVEALVDKLKEGTIRKSERTELDMFLNLEHVMRMAKAKARHSTARAA